MSFFSRLLRQLTARDSNGQSKAEVEELVKTIVQEHLQQQAEVDNRDVLHSLIKVVKERAARPAETQRDPEVNDLLEKLKELNAGKETQKSANDESSKQAIREVLREMLDREGPPAQQQTRNRTRESTSNINMVLPWCDGPNPDSQSKFAATGKQLSEEKVSASDAQNKNLNKGPGKFEKNSLDGQHKNFSRGRGVPRGGRARSKSRPREATAGPLNETQASRGWDSGFNQHQRWSQEGAVGYSHPSAIPQHLVVNNIANGRPYGMVPPPAVYHSNRGARSHQPGGNMNHVAPERTFSPRGSYARGRGGYSRGSRASRPDMKSSSEGIRPSFADLTADLLPEDMALIKNALKYYVNQAPQDKVAFKQKKIKQGGTRIGEKSGESEEDETVNLPTKENKVFVNKPSSGAQLTGAKKKNKTVVKSSGRPEEDQKHTGAATVPHCIPGSTVSKNVKLTLGLGIYKDVLKNVDGDQEVRHVVLEANCRGETRKFRPKTIGQLRGFMDLYPDTRAVVTIE